MTIQKVPFKGCYVCSALGENPATPITDEHIIPQLIGGRKKKPILCKQHNDFAGDTIDPGLLEIFQTFRVYLGLIPTSKKKPKKWEAIRFKMPDSGQEFYINSYGDAYLADPKVTKTDLGHGKFQLNINASTDEEIKKLLKQIKNAFPKADTENFIRTDAPKDQSTHYNMSVLLAGDQIEKAVTKVAISYAVSEGIDPTDLKSVIRYCFEKGSGPFVTHIDDFLVGMVKNNSFNHTIVLHGSPVTKLLVAFIEFFGCAPFMVLLSDQYSGNAIDCSYTMDPTKKTLDNCSAKVTLTREDFDKLFKNDGLVPNGFLDCYKHGLAAAMLRQKSNRSAHEIIEKVFDQMKSEGHDCVTVKNVGLFSNYFAEEFLSRRLKERQTP